MTLDSDDMDGAELRESERKALRLLLEKDRSRDRLAKKLKFWSPLLATGTIATVSASQAGLFDWIAGILVHMRHK